VNFSAFGTDIRHDEITKAQDKTSFTAAFETSAAMFV